MTVGPIKVKARKSIIFAEGSPEVGSKVGLEKTLTQMVEGCLRTMKSCHICIRGLKKFLVKYEKYVTLSIHV